MQQTTNSQDAALLLLRVICAVIFFYAGYAKWSFWSVTPEGMSSGMASLMKFLSIVEPLGGLALIVGLLTRYAAAGLAIIMFGALFFVRLLMHAGFFTTPQGTGMDYILLILSGCIALMAFGAGSFSMDAMREKVS